jgi:polar amino acid transport system substrate-binding protein
MTIGLRGLSLPVAGLMLAACGSGNSSPSISSSSGAQASLTSQCAPLRTQYPNIPKQWTVAVSPFNGNLEEVDPTNPSNIIGVEPDLISEIGQCLGTTFTYASQPFAGVIASLTSGTAQLGITGLFIKPDRVKVIDMVSHMTSTDELYTTPALNAQIKSPLDMCGRNIGETVGTAEATYVDSVSTQCTAAGKQAINQPHFQDIAALFANTVNGRIDGTINSDALAPQVLKQYAGQLVAGFTVPTFRFSIGIGVSKLTASTGLPDAVTAALKLIQSNGDDAKILKKWNFPASAQVPVVLSSTP